MTTIKHDIERLIEKIEVEPILGCWLWTAAIDPNGYAAFTIGGKGKKISGHVAAYRLLRGEIPAGLQLDHETCSIKHCVNPWHLVPKTGRENSLRSDGPPAKNARKTHCIHGHPLSGRNLYITPDGRRQCRVCNRDRSTRHEYLRRRSS